MEDFFPDEFPPVPRESTNCIALEWEKIYSLQVMVQLRLSQLVWRIYLLSVFSGNKQNKLP